MKPIQDPKKKILALYDFRIQNQQRVDFRGCPFMKINYEITHDEQKVVARIREYKSTVKEQILKLVQKSDHKKILSDEALADLIFLTLEGGMSSASIFRNTEDLKNARNAIKELL